ncbi:MAG: hypothetical protein ABIP17_02680 [Ilumatobacteraceae bacterium]
MTGEDHNTDALLAALRSPALPVEQVGEAAVVTLMVDAQRAAVHDLLPGPRSRRGVAIAAITVASLGLGGLVAAGPGFFSPAADRPVVPVPTSVHHGTVDQGDTGDDVSSTSSPDSTDAEDSVTPARNESQPASDGGILCSPGNHGRTVSSIARDSDPNTSASDAAHSNCGKKGGEPVDDDGADDPDTALSGVTCADGTHGDTVSSVARAEPSASAQGDAASAAARSKCGKPNSTGRPDNTGQPATTGQPETTGKKPATTGQRETPAVEPDKPDTSDKPTKPDDAVEPPKPDAQPAQPIAPVPGPPAGVGNSAGETAIDNAGKPQP